MITIQAKREGFRRCGVAHSRAAVEYADDHFTPDELAVLKAEPQLVVVEVPDPGGSGTGRPNAADSIKLVKEAGTMAELDELASGEDRKSVLAAIEARRQALTPDGDNAEED